jgi:hypothetical protein
MMKKLEEVIAHLEVLARTVACPKGSGCCCVKAKVWSAYRATSIGLTDNLLCCESDDVDCMHRVNSDDGVLCKSAIRVYKSKVMGKMRANDPRVG